ncbi:MAG: urate hydroxylase PuuD, partial [Paracoccaceae bacterium]|nr:urate hydroxylase PuuD [Paracoccaceae bacterium]
GISIGSLVFGWIMYDLICKSKFGDNNTRLMIGLYIILVAMSWGYTHVFSGRAALLHLGAFTATIMTANVFFIIMPNQRIVVADLKAGRKPDPKYGKIAKQRSTHNNYLTLPVLFLMLSNHYPLAFATKYNWIIASLVFLMGVTIRHYFNTRHSRKGNPTWTWLVTALIFVLIAWLSTAPMFATDTKTGDITPSPADAKFAQAPGFQDVTDIVMGRCSMCHAKEPSYDGIHWAPKGVRLETPNEIAHEAERIYIQAGVTHAMPPANLSFIEPAERAKIVAWYRAAVGQGA